MRGKGKSVTVSVNVTHAHTNIYTITLYPVNTRALMIPAHRRVWGEYVQIIDLSLCEQWLWRSEGVKCSLVSQIMECHVISDVFQRLLSVKHTWIIHEICINQYPFSFHACHIFKARSTDSHRMNVHLSFISLVHLLDCFFLLFVFVGLFQWFLALFCLFVCPFFSFVLFFVCLFYFCSFCFFSCLFSCFLSCWDVLSQVDL